MRAVLVILCTLMILFAGGCAIIVLGSGAGAFAALPAGIAIANALVISAVVGNRAWARTASYFLAAVDLIVGIPLLIISMPSQGFDAPEAFALMVALVLVPKGVITIFVAARLPKPEGLPSGQGDSNRGNAADS